MSTTTLPVAAAPIRPQPQALQVFDAEPGKPFLTHKVEGPYFRPHLKAGEIAVIDPKDKTPVDGEVYVVEWSSGRRDLVQARARPNTSFGVKDKKTGEWRKGKPTTGWYLGDLIQARTVEEMKAWIAMGVTPRLSEGPLQTRHLRSKLVGRVVGVWSPPPILVGCDPAILPERYVMPVDGDCMLPEIKSGTKLLFSRTEPIHAGDLVVIFKRTEVLQPGEFQAIVKRLEVDIPKGVTFPTTRRADELLRVSMNNPPTQLGVPFGAIQAVHRCLGPLPKNHRVFQMKVADLKAASAPAL